MPSILSKGNRNTTMESPEKPNTTKKTTARVKIQIARPPYKEALRGLIQHPLLSKDLVSTSEL